jgi:hypothetical protein
MGKEEYPGEKRRVRILQVVVDEIRSAAFVFIVFIDTDTKRRFI